MTKYTRNAAIVSLAMLASTSGAFAATATDDLDVTLTVEATCSVVANPLDFGTRSVFTANIDAATTLDVTCSDGTAYDIGLDAGDGASATTTTRKLTNGSSGTVNYTLWKDSGRTSNFGATGGELLTGTGDGTAQSIDVYGRIPSGQTVATGAYTDTVTVTITYTP